MYASQHKFINVFWFKKLWFDSFKSENFSKTTNVFTTTIMSHYDFMFVNYAVIPQQCCI